MTIDAVGYWTMLKNVDYNRVAYRENAFIEHEGRVVTWGEFGEAVDRLASHLGAVGIARGSHVGILMDSCPEYIVAHFAILRAGCVCVPYSTLQKPDELSYQLLHSETRAMVVGLGYAGLAASLPDSPLAQDSILTFGTGMGAGVGQLNEVLRAGGRLGPVPPAPTVADPALLLYTSGTTARPKGVLLSHGNLVQWALNVTAQCGYRKHDRLLHHFPLFHGQGGVQLVLPCVMRGATIVMVPRFSASRWAEQIATHRISVAALNATHIKMILAHPPSEFEVGSRLDRIHFSLPLDRQFRESFAERFGGPRLIELYGFTEGLGITFCTPLDGPSRPGSQGLPTPGYSVKLVDDQGLEVPLGQVGEVVVRTDLRYGLAAGYFKEPEQTAAAFRDGWFHTGDTGYLDPDGYFWFVERVKDMIKRSGLNVAPSEVERVLNDLPEVKDSVVVGIADEMREEAIAAFVVVEEGATFAPSSLEARCREVLADYKVPQHWFAVEEFPVNHVGKIDRKVLRRLATELTAQVKP